MKVCHFRDDFSNAFVTKRQTDRLRREAFGVRRIPALCESSARREAKAPEYGALQTLRAVRLRLGRTVDPARRDALPRQQPGAQGLTRPTTATARRILTVPPGRSADFPVDFPVRSNVERQEGFRRLLEPWEVRGLLRTGKSALRWRCQEDAPQPLLSLVLSVKSV